MDLPNNSSWCCSKEDEGKDVSSILLYCWLLLNAEKLDRCFSIAILIDDCWDAWWLLEYFYIVDCWWLLIDVSVLLYWLLMTAEMLDGCYSIAILLVVNDCWKYWWLLHYYYTNYWWQMRCLMIVADTVSSWWLLITERLDDWCSIDILLRCWWLISCLMIVWYDDDCQ